METQKAKYVAKLKLNEKKDVNDVKPLIKSIEFGMDYISGGSRAKENEFPFNVAISPCKLDANTHPIKGNFTWNIESVTNFTLILVIDCGGALISPSLVLSAFHCGAEHKAYRKKRAFIKDINFGRFFFMQMIKKNKNKVK